MRAAVARRRVSPILPSSIIGLLIGVAAATFLAAVALRSTRDVIHLGAPVLLCGVAAWMFFSERYEWTLAVLALYLGLLDGFLKLATGSTVATLGRDVLLYAIAGGALARVVLRRERLQAPPLVLGVIAWVAICLVQVLNPVAPSISHAFAGIRQHIEFVPLLFLGYAVMRSERRLIGLFWLLIVVAAANGIVSLVQSGLTPAELGAWGPGYYKEVFGNGVQTGRTFLDAATGVLHVRPPALGSDFGFGGAVGAMALPGALAIAVAGGRSRRYFAVLGLCVVLAVVGIVTSQSRAAVLGAVIAVIGFLLLTVTSRRGLSAIVVVALLTLITYVGLTTVLGGVTSGPNRYSSIAPNKVISTAIASRQGTIALIPTYLVDYPLGDGIGSTGPAGGSSVGGAGSSNGLDAESEPTFLIIELGIPGLVVMYALLFWGIRAGVSLRVLAERRLQVALAALTAVFISLCVGGAVGADTANSPTSPFIWLALGTLAYWYSEMLGGRLARRSRRLRATLAAR
jgi:hypothetical protein